jgi:hypothetical protein
VGGARAKDECVYMKDEYGYTMYSVQYYKGQTNKVEYVSEKWVYTLMYCVKKINKTELHTMGEYEGISR